MMLVRMRTLLLGEALVDLICERPVPSLVEADGFRPHFGGAAANVAVGAARAGADVALAGGAGDDAWGAWLLSRLEDEGVGLEWFDLLPGVLTPVAFVAIDEGGEPSYAIYGDTIQAVVEALEPRLLDAVGACDALFLSSNTLVGERERALTFAARDRAIELGRPLVVDPNLRLHRWGSAARAAAEARDLCRGAFVVKCNRDEARLLSGEEDLEAAAEGLLAAGAEHVVITRGADGAMLRGGGMRRDAAGQPVQPLSTVGAGDAFTGVLLARLAATGFYAPAIAAALPDAVGEATRAVQRWGALA
jgi:sugar/nucleoside kinase (ribokinase family)